jgi:hypothetical protein
MVHMFAEYAVESGSFRPATLRVRSTVIAMEDENENYRVKNRV